MKKILFLIVYLTSNFLFSQDIDVKSLEKKYSKGTIELSHAYQEKAKEEYSRGNLDAAVNYLNKAIINNEEAFASLYNVIGGIYSEQRKFKEAAINYEKFLKYFDQPNKLVSQKNDIGLNYFLIGSNYYFAQEYSKAIKYLEKALDSDYKNSGIANNLGWCYAETKEYEKAIKYFQIAYVENPKLINNINNLGYAYYLNNEFIKAKELILRAKQIDENNTFVYRNLGLIAMKENNKTEACALLEISVEKGIVEKWGELYIKELMEYCNE